MPYIFSLLLSAPTKLHHLTKKNKDFLPNIKNNKGETILDKSINDNYIYTTVKILEDSSGGKFLISFSASLIQRKESFKLDLS